MVQVVCLALIFTIIIVYLRTINSEIAVLATVCASIIILFYAFSYLSKGIEIIDKLINYTGINKEFLQIVFKISAIGYLVEFGAGTIADFGLKSLADKLVFVGKILIFSLSLPIIYSIFNLITGFLQ